MSDAHAPKGLRERLAGGTEDRLGRALSDLFENPLLNGALGRASDAREKAAQAQELAMGALNLPSAADIERLTRRLRSVSQRLEGIEDGVHRIGRNLSGQSIDGRLTAIEEQLRSLSGKLDVRQPSAKPSAEQPSATKPSATQPSATQPSATQPSATQPSATQPSATQPSATQPSATQPSATQPSAKQPSATQPSAKRSAKQPSPKRSAAKSSAAKRTAAKSSKPKR